MQVRQVSGCVVYVIQFHKLEVMLLSKNGKDWVHPKGGVEVDLTERESAAKEVWEEAGVTGKVGMELGSVDFFKNGKIQHVQMFALKADQIHEDYPEDTMRERRWFSMADAMKVLDRYNQVFVARLHYNLVQSGVLSE